MTAPDRSSDQVSDSADRIISRKVQAGKAEYQARAMTLAKALRLSVAKVGDAEYELALAVVGQRRESCIRDDLESTLGPDGLLMLLDGPAGLRGAAIMDAAFVGAMIQQQTMSKVLPPEGGEPRAPTSTDAAICAPFVEAMLSRASVLPEQSEERELLSGYAFGAWVEDLRVLVMALEAPVYEILRLTVDIASGVRQGNLMLCLPDPVEIKEDLPAIQGSEDGEELKASVPQTGRMVETVENLRADVRVSLAQLRMSLGKLGKLEVGATLDLGEVDFDHVRIETGGGKSLSRGTLGQVSGKRAVHIKSSGHAQKDAGGAGAFTPDTGAAAQSDSDGVSEDFDMDDLQLPEGMPAMEGDALPDLPDMEGLPDLPDMSDLPDLEDLPDFDLPNSAVG